MKRESFIFYRSFYEAIKDLPEESFRRVMIAVMGYGIDGIDSDLQGMERCLFTLMKPQLDANVKRYVDGKKGGRPSAKSGLTDTKPVVTEAETSGYEAENQWLGELEPNANVNVNVNVNENVNEKSQPHKIYGSEKNVKLTDRQYSNLVSDLGEDMTFACIEELSGYRAMKGYKCKRDDLAIRKWVIDAVARKPIHSPTPVINVKPNIIPTCKACGSTDLAPSWCRTCHWDFIQDPEQWLIENPIEAKP